MADFLERTLRFAVYPSQPYEDSDTDAPTIVDKKPRKILKARRLIKKTSEAAPKELRRISRKTPSSPEGPPTVAFRAIRKSICNKKTSIRQSDYSFLENERLCGIDGEYTQPLQDTPQPPLHGNLYLSKYTLQKRKLSDSTNLVPKKRRTLEIEKETAAVKSSLSKSKQAFKPKAMPNFARIFQVQSDNTENIIEFKERTADRAAKLLSGAKPVRSAAAPTTAPKIKKELTFTTENSPNMTKLPKIKRELIICTPYPGKKAGKHCTPIPMQFNENKITNRLRSAAKPVPISNSTPNIATTNSLLSGIQNKGIVRNIKQDSANRFGFKNLQILKINKQAPQTLSIPKIKSSEKAPNYLKKATVTQSMKNISAPNPKSLSPLRSKLPLKKIVSVDLKPVNTKPIRVKKDELVKAVQTKMRPEREIGSRRLEIKGVRLNRRFQLLMQMRGNDTSIL